MCGGGGQELGPMRGSWPQSAESSETSEGLQQHLSKGETM